MKVRRLFVFAAVILFALSAAGCGKKNDGKKTPAPVQNPAKAEAAIAKEAQAMKEAPVATGQASQVPTALAGSISETMDSGGYTYVQVDTGSEKHWVAGPQTAVKVGDKVALDGLMPMQNFTSRTLDRTFPVIFFVQKIEIVKE